MKAIFRYYSIILLVALVLGSVLSQESHAQISFDRADLESDIGTSIQPESRFAADGQEAGILALEAITGASQTWDFTGLTFNDPAASPVLQEYIPLPDASIPGSTDPRVAGATFVIKTTDPAATPGDYSVVFFGLTDTQYTTYGTWAIVNGQANDMLYDTPMLSHSLPLAFGSEWEGETTYSTSTQPPADITLTQTGTANGWGTLITPYGTVEALRYELELDVSTEINIGFPIPPTVVTTRIINFVSHEGISAAITITDIPQGGQSITASVVTRGETPDVDPPDTAPATPSPENGATVSTDPLLGWDAVNGATSYDLQVATGSFGKSTPDDVVVDVSGITETSYQVSGLEAGTSYFWRVRGVNEGGAGDWSTSFTFETEAAVVILPGDVTLTSPADGAVDQETSLTFTWSAATDTDTYDFQLATDAAFSSLVESETGLTATEFAVAGLSNETGYFWRVRGENAEGTGNWTSAGFTTIAVVITLPGDVTLASPEDGAMSVDLSPTLQWDAASNALSYDVQVSLSSDFTLPIVDETALGTTSFSLSGLAATTVHYWRVRGVNEGGAGAWAEASFTTAGNVAIEQMDSAIPSSFELHDSYPNPFNPQTTIGFDLDKSAHVSLSVWDVTGRLVERIVDSNMSAGRYSYRWNAGGLNSGVYLIRLEAGNNIKSSTVTLLK